MPVFRISSDPHAVLRPIYRELTTDPAFAMLSSERQWDLLVQAVAATESATHAAKMREYSYAARVALLRHLANMEAQRPLPRQVMMWLLWKDDRVLSCICRYIPSGIDVRLAENGEMRRTMLVKDGPAAEGTADEWRDAALKLGWQEPPR